MARKVLLLHLSGISPDLMSKYIEQGELPNFERMIREGAFFKTESVLNSAHIVTRTSALSGLNPGKSGIFDSMRPTKDYRPKLTEVSNEVEEKTLPTLLGNGGMKARRIKEPLGETEEKGALDEGKIDEERFLEEIHQSERKNLNRTRDFMKEDWDYLEANFSIIDKIQHVFYRCIDDKHPAYNPRDAERYGDVILKAYKEGDEYLGTLWRDIEKMQNQALLVFSDKGIAPVYKHVHINNFLAEKEVIVLKEGGKGFEDVDWNETLAYQIGSGQIRVNLKGREAKGIVEKGKEYWDVRSALIKLLKDMKDPETGEEIVEKVFKMEELYSGLYLEDAPDLLVIFKRGYKNSLHDALGIFGGDVISKNRGKWSADHVGLLPSEIPGIFIALDTGIKQGDFGTMSIMDLAPTILYYLGVSIPKNMDGKVLEEMFEGDFLKKNPVRYHEIKEEIKRIERREEGVLSEEDEEKIKERLRGLGYMA